MIEVDLTLIANISSFSRRCVLCFPGHDIVASFMLEKPTSFVKDNILQLADDIFDEISVSHTKVCPIVLPYLRYSSLAYFSFAISALSHGFCASNRWK